MKAPVSVLIRALFFLLPVFAKAVSCGDVMGQLINLDTRQPVGNTEIIFENYYYKISVTANQNGYYYASHLPEGRYQVRVIYKQRTFVMNHVKVYDGYANEVNFFVSANDTLPAVVLETTPNPVINIFQQNDIVLTGTGPGLGTQSFSDVLMAMPGVDIYGGRLYIKGYGRNAEAKIFIDGSPSLMSGTFSK